MPQDVPRRVYPLVTDIHGLRLMDPIAAQKYVWGWEECVKSQTSMRGHPEKVRFALTPNKGWDAEGDGISCLGYHESIPGGWTFYEYDHKHALAIFGGERVQWVFPPVPGSPVAVGTESVGTDVAEVRIRHRTVRIPVEAFQFLVVSALNELEAHSSDPVQEPEANGATFWARQVLEHMFNP